MTREELMNILCRYEGAIQFRLNAEIVRDIISADRREQLNIYKQALQAAADLGAFETLPVQYPEEVAKKVLQETFDKLGG